MGIIKGSILTQAPSTRSSLHVLLINNIKYDNARGKNLSRAEHNLKAFLFLINRIINKSYSDFFTELFARKVL